MNSFVKKLVTSPRHVFTPDHVAQLFIHCQGMIKEGQALDVSKDHIAIACEQCIDVRVGETVEQIKLTLNGKTFELQSLTVIKKEALDNNKGVRIVLRNEDDEETSRVLWQISYELRQDGHGNQAISYDDITLPKVPARGLYTEDARQERLAYIRENTDAKLDRVADTTLEAKALVSNIEALVGSVEIPVGIAGPLHIKGGHADGLFYAPMATTEGALLASATRGATALSRSGGVNVRVIGQRMLRVPVFVLTDLNSAIFFSEWVKDHYAEICEQTK